MRKSNEESVKRSRKHVTGRCRARLTLLRERQGSGSEVFVRQILADMKMARLPLSAIGTNKVELEALKVAASVSGR